MQKIDPNFTIYEWQSKQELYQSTWRRQSRAKNRSSRWDDTTALDWTTEWTRQTSTRTRWSETSRSQEIPWEESKTRNTSKWTQNDWGNGKNGSQSRGWEWQETVQSLKSTSESKGITQTEERYSALFKKLTEKVISAQDLFDNFTLNEIWYIYSPEGSARLAQEVSRRFRAEVLQLQKLFTKAKSWYSTQLYDIRYGADNIREYVEVYEESRNWLKSHWKIKRINNNLDRLTNDISSNNI